MGLSIVLRCTENDGADCGGVVSDDDAKIAASI
jgi:hypothetical protein